MTYYFGDYAHSIPADYIAARSIGSSDPDGSKRLAAIEVLLVSAAVTAHSEDDYRMLGIAVEAWEIHNGWIGYCADAIYYGGWQGNDTPRLWTLEQAEALVERARRGKPKRKLRHEAQAFLDSIPHLFPRGQ